MRPRSCKQCYNRSGSSRSVLIFTLGVICGVFGFWLLKRDHGGQEGAKHGNQTSWNDSITVTAPKKVLEAAKKNSSHIYAGVPRSPNYPHQLLVLENIGYIVGYDETRKNPAWVAYRMFRVGPVSSPPRPSRFMVDTRTLSQVRHDDYTNSGFDRGHMAPNYGIATRYGVKGQLETFFMTNIVPQTPTLNRQLWRRLEERIARHYANEYEEVWVVTGPVYDAQQQTLFSGVEIPDGFFKIVLDEDEGTVRVLAFVLPHRVSGNERLNRFLTNVDEVEQLTGLDFFSELPDQIEDPLESVVASQLWGDEEAGILTVFITATGKRYHYPHCRYAVTGRPVSIPEAKKRGLLQNDEYPVGHRVAPLHFQTRRRRLNRGQHQAGHRQKKLCQSVLNPIDEIAEVPDMLEAFVGDAKRSHQLTCTTEDGVSPSRSGASHIQARRNRYG